MMRGLVALGVVVMLASTAMGTSTWGPTDYLGKAFINFGDSTASYTTTGVSERFTARSNATVGSIKMQMDSTTNLSGPPTVTLGIYADDGAGSPGAALGVSAPFVLPAASPLDFTGTLLAPANLVTGNVYHATLLYVGQAGSLDQCRLRIGEQKSSFDQRTLNGRLEIDNMLAGLFYLTGHAVYPDGWYEGKPAEYTKVWEPMFGLYDEQAVGLDEGEGADTRYYDRNDYRQNPYAGNRFLVQNVPAPDMKDANTTQVYQIHVATRVVDSGDLGDLLVRLLDDADNQLASAQKTVAQMVSGWNTFDIPLTDLTIGSGYKVVLETVGTSDYYNRYEPYFEQFGTVTPLAASWQGLSAYAVESFDSGVTYGPHTNNWEFKIQLELIPEPATLGLLVIGGLAILARKRR